MLFDDRLATVLRYGARSEAAARTQYRQLLDLLGTMPHRTASPLVEAAYDRLGELAEVLPSTVQSAILRTPGLRLRSTALLAWLAAGDPQAAAAAMATAQLPDSDWLDLIPRLPVTARGFLRHRRDLPPGARQVLERLGVRDLALPEPEAKPRPASAHWSGGSKRSSAPGARPAPHRDCRSVTCASRNRRSAAAASTSRAIPKGS